MKHTEIQRFTWQFDPLDAKGMIEVTDNKVPFLLTQTLGNAQKICSILNNHDKLVEALTAVHNDYNFGHLTYNTNKKVIDALSQISKDGEE